MEVTPISGPVWPVEPVARPEGGALDGSGMERRPAADRPPPAATLQGGSPPPQTSGVEETLPGMDELRRLASQEQLELRLEALPHSGIVRIRIVDSLTGKVIREFPPEGISGAIEELRVRQMSHLDARG